MSGLGGDGIELSNVFIVSQCVTFILIFTEILAGNKVSCFVLFTETQSQLCSRAVTGGAAAGTRGGLKAVVVLAVLLQRGSRRGSRQARTSLSSFSSQLFITYKTLLFGPALLNGKYPTWKLEKESKAIAHSFQCFATLCSSFFMTEKTEAFIENF